MRRTHDLIMSTAHLDFPEEVPLRILPCLEAREVQRLDINATYTRKHDSLKQQ